MLYHQGRVQKSQLDLAVFRAKKQEEIQILWDLKSSTLAQILSAYCTTIEKGVGFSMKNRYHPQKKVERKMLTTLTEYKRLKLH